MPHFVIRKNNLHAGNGQPSFAVEWMHSCKDLNGSRYEHTCQEIDEITARKPLNILIDLHQRGSALDTMQGPDCA